MQAPPLRSVAAPTWQAPAPGRHHVPSIAVTGRAAPLPCARFTPAGARWAPGEPLAGFYRALQADFPELPEALLAALGAALAAAGSFGLKDAPVDPNLLCKLGESMGPIFAAWLEAMTADVLSEGGEHAARRYMLRCLQHMKQAYLRGDEVVAVGTGLKAARRGPAPPLALLVAPAAELEAALQAVLAEPKLATPGPHEAPPPKAVAAPAPLGARCDMPQEAQLIFQDGRLQRLHASAIKALGTLCADRQSLTVSQNLDFGLRQVVKPPPPPPPPPPLYPGNQSGLRGASSALAEVAALAAPGGLTATLAQLSSRVQDTGTPNAGACVYFRQMVLTNYAPHDVLLLDVRALPERPHTFALFDDVGVCRAGGLGAGGSSGPHRPPPTTAVRLQRQERCYITVALDCRDNAHRSAESGVLHTCVIFTVLVPAAASCGGATPHPPLSCQLPSGAAVVVLGRRATVALAWQAAEVTRLLRSEAPPFAPSHLRALFDTPPSLYHGIAPPLAPMFALQMLPETQCWWLQGAPGGTWEAIAPPAHKQVGAMALLRAGLQYEQAALSAEVRQLRRLLILEEAAMESDTRRHDMFSARLKFAVFAAQGIRAYQLHKSFPPSDGSEVTARHFPYRGPSLAVALQALKVGNGLSPGAHLAPARAAAWPNLLALDVPGLPEGRPALVFGDVVYLRFADAPGVEYATAVVATEQATCLLAAPPALWQRVTLAAQAAAKSAPAQNAPSAAGNGAPTGAKEPGAPAAPAAGGLRSRGEAESGAPADAGGGVLVHARFSFDRTPLRRMHAALAEAARAGDDAIRLLPAPGRATGAGLPTHEDFLNAVSAPPRRPHVHTDTLPSLAEVQQRADAIHERGARTLNAEQRLAVAAHLCGAGGRVPFALFGPPGTGKTITLVECALQVLIAEPDAHVLLTAPANFSADLLASALAAAGVSKGELLRLNDPRRPINQAKEDVLTCSCIDGALGAFSLPPPERVAACRAVVATCGAAGLLREGSYAAAHIQFSHVLMDEAGQALLPEALVPLTLLAPHGRALLCGDPKQLGPVVHSPVAAAGAGDGGGLAVSLLERVMAAHQREVVQQIEAGTAPATGMLVRNYRSHASLLQVPNKLFYEQRLEAAAPQDALLAPPAWGQLRVTCGDDEEREAVAPHENGHASADELDEEGLPSTLFFGVRGQQVRDGEAPAYYNAVEAAALVELVAGLLQQAGSRVKANDLGVIATYRKQVQKIRLLLRERGLGAVRVGTVDDYQGQEERIILISTVLSRPESLPKPAAPGGAGAEADAHLGFWRNPKRFNVAITRAKALLVVVGHPVVLLEDPNWRSLLHHCAAHGAFRGAGAELVAGLQLRNSDAEGTGCASAPDAEEVGAAAGMAAELALLGGGDADRLYPGSLEEAYAAGADEAEWRVMI
ncbi:hypothetical protein WJX81_000626 [Elliptochloris bilobata]|uniref:RNA helicase n=1 Tax=Elliptochloris bilobata TaxID=381761 RepID=A0AAW1QV67_9CHLO